MAVRNDLMDAVEVDLNLQKRLTIVSSFFAVIERHIIDVNT